MKNIHRTITWENAEAYPEFFDLADKVAELLGIAVDNLGQRTLRWGDMPQAQIIVLFNTYKASNAFISCLTLCDKGFAGDAKTICRKLLETHITIKYLLIDREKHEKLYWDYFSVQMKRETDKALKNKGNFPKAHLDLIGEVRRISAERLTEIEKSWERSEKGKLLLEYKRFWSGKHLGVMAKECGLGYMYYRAYMSYCRSTHSNIDDIIHYCDFKDNAFNQFVENEDIPLVLYDCILNMTGILDCVIEVFGMDLRKSLEQLRPLIRLAESDWLVRYSKEDDG